jgi:hypothetical protein
MKRIIQKTSVTNEQKLNDILSNTTLIGQCMEWKGCFNTDGYARMANNVKVHRLVYELKTSENIQGYVVRHSSHLICGTVAENAHDKFVRDRQPRIVTKEKVFIANSLLKLGIQSQKEIAAMLNLNERRISDIKCGKYCSATGKFLGHG